MSRTRFFGHCIVAQEPKKSGAPADTTARNDAHFSTVLSLTSTALPFVEWARCYLLGRRLMLAATVSRGKKRGTRLLPHRFKDDRYRVQLGKQGPYIPVTDYRDISSYLANGYSLHMSDRAEGQTSTLIRPQSIPWCTHTFSYLFFTT